MENLTLADFVEAMEERTASAMTECWEAYAGLAKLCESPIERKLFAALYMAAIRQEACGGFVPFLCEWRIQPQYVIGPYRTDFAVCYLRQDRYDQDPFQSPKAVRVVVECDGHDFHEKTKEQAARDKARDRFLITNGWPVLRFTGSEIFNGADECAWDVIGALCAEIGRSLK